MCVCVCWGGGYLGVKAAVAEGTNHPPASHSGVFVLGEGQEALGGAPHESVIPVSPRRTTTQQHADPQHLKDIALCVVRHHNVATFGELQCVRKRGAGLGCLGAKCGRAAGPASH